MMYADRFPNRVKGLILFGALQPKSPTTTSDSALQAASDSMASAFFQRPELAATLEREGLNRDSSQLSARQQTFAWRIRFAAVNIFHVDRWRSVRGGKVFYNSGAASAASRTRPAQYDYTSTLAGLDCPVIVIAGDHDFVDMGAVMHRRWASQVPNVQVAVIVDAGHNVWIDAPDEFRRQLIHALRRAAKCR
jgi:pimeloyl-ACP methyl ester carboxylesterase